MGQDSKLVHSKIVANINNIDAMWSTKNKVIMYYKKQREEIICSDEAEAYQIVSSLNSYYKMINRIPKVETLDILKGESNE